MSNLSSTFSQACFFLHMNKIFHMRLPFWPHVNRNSTRGNKTREITWLTRGIFICLFVTICASRASSCVHPRVSLHLTWVCVFARVWSQPPTIITYATSSCSNMSHSVSLCLTLGLTEITCPCQSSNHFIPFLFVTSYAILLPANVAWGVHVGPLYSNAPENINLS